RSATKPRTRGEHAGEVASQALSRKSVHRKTMDEQMPLWRLLTAFLLLSHFGCAGIDQSVDPSGASEPADPAALPGEARAFASDSKHGGDAVSDARERIIGTWIRTNHGSASTHLVYLVTPIASEIEFHSDGTFRARYEG